MEQHKEVELLSFGCRFGLIACLGGLNRPWCPFSASQHGVGKQASGLSLSMGVECIWVHAIAWAFTGLGLLRVF